jgi:hypothetical protein
VEVEVHVLRVGERVTALQCVALWVCSIGGMNGSDSGKQQYSEKSLSQCHIHYKSHID